jgi:[ribosomal protein S18]-alanine N-acetyltransferase
MSANRYLPLSALTAAQWQMVYAIEAANHIRPWSAQQLRECLAAGYEAHALVGEGDGVLGYCIFMRNVDEWELLNITVDVVMQGQGLGRALLEHGLAQAIQAGTSGIFLEVRVSNAAALGLYTALGFKAVGRRKGYYRTLDPLVQEDATVMRLDLAPRNSSGTSVT